MDYLLGLKSLAFLFSEAGVSSWWVYINEDIRLWNENHDVMHHLRAYGGMGSINDVVICTQNGHRIERHQEPWANALLQFLLSWCSYSARCIQDKAPSLFTVEKANICKSTKIHGRRCLQCGYAELTKNNNDNFIAPVIVEKRLKVISDEHEIYKIINKLLCANDSEIDILRQRLTYAEEKSGIHYRESEWMRICPNCGSNDIAVYRWELVGSIFDNSCCEIVSSTDNLPLRGKK